MTTTRSTLAVLAATLLLGACAGTGGPALRHVQVADEHPFFRDCAAVTLANIDGPDARADQLSRCLTYPQVATTPVVPDGAL